MLEVFINIFLKYSATSLPQFLIVPLLLCKRDCSNHITHEYQLKYRLYQKLSGKGLQCFRKEEISKQITL